MDFNYYDIAIVVIILITALIGFMRGLVWMGIFLATWSAAILLAIKFKDTVAVALPVKLSSEIAQTALAALLIFLGVLIAGAIINFILHKIINAIGLGTFDRILGMGLGIVLGALAITLLTLLASNLTELPKTSIWQDSKFIPKFQESAAWLQTLIPEDLNDLVNEKLEQNNIIPSSSEAAKPAETVPAPNTPSSESSTTN